VRDSRRLDWCESQHHENTAAPRCLQDELLALTTHCENERTSLERSPVAIKTILKAKHKQGHLLVRELRIHRGRAPEYDIASLYMVSFYCFVTKACVRRPSAAASVEQRRRERRTLLAGAAGELAGATRQARPSSACTFSDVHQE
jgi:hypothetical protein